MRDTPRTDAFVDSPEVWHYSGFCDGLDCRIARESTRDFAKRLERELNEATEKLRLAREGIVTIAHGKESMRDYANRVLADTALESSSNAEGHGRRSRTVQPLVGSLDSEEKA